MKCNRFFLVFVFLPISVVCCATEVVEESVCEQFEFEDKVLVQVRRGSVGVLNSRLESGAPRDIISMQLALPEVGPSEFIKEVQISAFFRPIETDAVECQTLPAKSGHIFCYMNLQSKSVQLLAVFDESDQTDFTVAMRRLADNVKRTALSCD